MRILILRKLRALVRSINKSRTDNPIDIYSMPEVSTVDAYQGKDKTSVLLSLVISHADERADVGFLMNNNRVHMACTRAKDFFWIISSQGVSQGTLFNDWKAIQPHALRGGISSLP